MADYCPSCGVDVLRTAARFCDQCGLELTTTFAGEATIASPLSVVEEETRTTFLKTPVGKTAHSFSETTGLNDETINRPEATRAEVKSSRPDPAKAQAVKTTSTARPAASKITIPTGIDITGVLIHQRYQVIKTLGKGGFGAVYLAQDIKLGRLCVVKQMLPKQKTPKKLAIDRANFEREAKLLVQLNQPGHPNIPEIYDHFFEEKGNYLVMKYIKGRSLQQILEDSQTGLPLEDVIRYAVDLGSALHYMHTHFAEPVMHRDIKPSNILLGDDGRIWLVDFGLAKAQPVDDSGDAAVTQGAGSTGYTPLEQWLGEAVPASDIYALGATLHYLLTGVNPLKSFGNEFNILKVQQMHGQFLPIRKLNKNLPEALEGIIAGATGADPASIRYSARCKTTTVPPQPTPSNPAVRPLTKFLTV